MIKTAVILAAGKGSRLTKVLRHKPKGFLIIEGRAIIEMSLLKLIAAGIEKIIIGTGHLKYFYHQLSSRFPQVICVDNNQYETSGSMYTLFNLRDYVTDDFILLESDIIYEKDALKILLYHDKTDVMLASELTNTHDEVFIETDKNNYLVNLSKKKEDLGSIYAEMIGINKICYKTFIKLCDLKSQLLEFNTLDYEQALTGMAKESNIYVHRVCDLAWCEIDDENHWQRAATDIYPKILSREAALPPVKRNILLNPGPATTTDSVKYAQVVPDICPREKSFGDVMQFISTELTRFVADPGYYTAILFSGSGTAAVEAILSSVIADQDTLLIINNGAYGKRMCQIARAYGLNHIVYDSLIDQPINITDLESVINKSSKKLTHLAIVHNETTTGLLNDIEEIGNLCKKNHLILIVDAMSSFGAIPIDMIKMNISYLAASSNKNIQGMAGASFVIAHNDRLNAIENIRTRNVYLNLYAQYKYFIETGQMRFTPPVQVLYALRQAIIELQQETIPSRYERYSQSWQTLIKGIGKLGLKPLIKIENHSKIITAIIEPTCPRYHFVEMHDYLYKRGFTIYPGKLEGLNTFRIANIGDIAYQDIEKFLSLLEQYFEEIK